MPPNPTTLSRLPWWVAAAEKNIFGTMAIITVGITDSIVAQSRTYINIIDAQTILIKTLLIMTLLIILINVILHKCFYLLL
jgi:hypothetical protein